MVVDGSVARCASKVFVLSVHNVHMRLGVAVTLRKTKINGVYDVGAATKSWQHIKTNKQTSILTKKNPSKINCYGKS